MFIAALTSLSRTEEQLLQVHSRSFSCSSLFIAPQLEQVLEDGSNCPIRMTFLPHQSALYSNIVTKVDQLASDIDCARQWFCNIFLTANVSIAIVWFSLISFVETLCRKSLRLFFTFSCCLASFFFVRLPLYFEYLRCKYFNFDCALRRYLGFSNTSPSEVIAKSLIPKSIPMVVSSVISGLVGISSPVSQRIDAKYLPVEVRDIVARLITPFVGRCKTIFKSSLNFGKDNLLSFKDTFCGTVKEPLSRFFLNLGYPAPLKKFLKAVSKFCTACCKDWELISFSHVNSFFREGSCLIKSKADNDTPNSSYAVRLVSSARLYTSRVHPMCLAISSFCKAVGYNLYLKVFSIYYIKRNILRKVSKCQNYLKCKCIGVAYIPSTPTVMNGFYDPSYKIWNIIQWKNN